MSQILLIVIVCFLVFNYLFGLLLEYLDSSLWSDKIPQELENIYDPEKYRQSQQYDKANTRFSIISGIFSFAAILIMVVSGGFGWLDTFLRTLTENPVLLALSFFGVLGLASALLSLPFDIYDTFVIEQKFGFNTTTKRTFVADKLKSGLLTIILGGGILSFVVWVYDSSGQWFWLITWGALTAFMLLMSLFYSNLIVPLFNKQKPLEEGALRRAIEAFAVKTGFSLKNIYVIDGSKRSKKANAYFTGFGPKKRIVLYDTLISHLSAEEIIAVLAHETGHYKKKHVLYGLIGSVISNGLMLYILSLFIGNNSLAESLGGQTGSFHMGILAFALLYSPLSILTGIITNMISRHNEYAADKYACIHHNSDDLKNGLKKLSVMNLSNLRPHPFRVFISYSHPTLLQRIEAIDKLNLKSF